MANNYQILSEDAIKYLCGLIRDLASVSEGIDNINLADDKTFSNIYIKNLIDKCLEDANAEAEKLVGALTHLTCEETAIQPTLDNSEINVIYLYSANGNPPYQQFLKISEDKLIDLGSTSISLEDYIKVADVAKDYATKVELKAVTDKIGTTTLTTTDTTITGAIEEVKGIAEGKADKSEIPTTLPANGGNSDTVNNHTVKSDVPENAVFTDTIYDDTEIKVEISKKADKEKLSKLENSGIADEILINNSIGRNMSWSELENAKTVTYFTNWNDSTHFPNLYGSGVLIPGLDASNKYIIYIDNNNTEYINVKAVNGWSGWKELATMDKVADLGSYINGVKLTPTTDGNLENQVDIGTIKLPKGKWIIFASGWNPTVTYDSEIIIGLKGSVDFIRQYKTVMFNFSAFRNVTTETTYTLAYSQGSGTSKNVTTNYDFYAVKVGF